MSSTHQQRKSFTLWKVAVNILGQISKNNMKKPAAAMRNDVEPKKNGGSMKRPAAIGSLNKSLEDLRGGLKKAKKCEDDAGRTNAEKSEHESGNEDSDQNRDKGKAIKFRQMQKELPPHIVDL